MSSTLLLKALAAVGVITLVRMVNTAYQFLTFHLVTPAHPLAAYKRDVSNNFSDDPDTKTSWALVTGSSAGIGRGIAQELLRQGFGVIIHSHLAEELDETAAALRQLIPDLPPTARVKTLVLDARTATHADIQSALATTVAHLPLTILVNNVGGNPVREPNFLTLAEHAPDDVDAVLNQNNRFMSQLTAQAIPLLVKSKQRDVDKSLIINLASAGMVGIPFMVLYGATKGFVHSFSVGLARELRLSEVTRHIHSVCVVPGEVKTQGNSRGVPEGAPSWDLFGREVVMKMDGAVKRGWWSVLPHLRHGIEFGLLGMLAGDVVDKEVTATIRRKKDAWWEVKRREGKMK